MKPEMYKTLLVTAVFLGLLLSGSTVNALYYEDQFDSGIDTGWWSILPTYPNAVQATNGHIEITESNAACATASYNQGLKFNYPIIGDFTATVDYTLLDWPATSNSCGYVVNGNGERVGLTTRPLDPPPTGWAGNAAMRLSNWDPYPYEFYGADFSGQRNNLSTSDSAGQLKLVRAGNTFSAYSWNGSNYTLIHEHTYPSDSTPGAQSTQLLELRTWAYLATPGVKIAFDNFTLDAPNTPDWGICFGPVDGLASWWPGDENPNDRVGGHNGTLYGNTGYAMGWVDQAFSFDGNGDYMITPNVIAEWPSGTIDLWVKFNYLSGNSDQIFSSWGPDDFDNGYDPIHMWAKGWDNTQGFTFGFCTGTTFPCTWQLAHSNIIPVADRWYHLAGTWGSEGIKLYVNGVLRATNPYTGPAPRTTNHMIGASYWSTVHGNVLPVHGLIDEVQIFNRALTANEIAAIYNAGTAGYCKTNQPPVAQCNRVVTTLKII